MDSLKIFAVYILSGSLLDISTQAKPLKGENVTSVQEGKYPFVVSIAQRNYQLHAEDSHICTGVLITKEFVLTAAHCFDGLLLCEIQVLVGSVDLRKSKKYDPSMWITYNRWAENKNITKESDTNDIAIIQLSSAVPRRVAKPASLSISKKNSELYSARVVLVGWGSTNHSPEKSSRYLQESRIKVLPNVNCEKMLYNLLKKEYSILDKYLCSKGEPQAYLANGDSGGPALLANSVVAINGGVCPKDGICDSPEEVINAHKFNFHTKIRYYKKFIDNVIKNY